jgi:hypothetical protein
LYVDFVVLYRKLPEVFCNLTPSNYKKGVVVIICLGRSASYWRCVSSFDWFVVDPLFSCLLLSKRDLRSGGFAFPGERSERLC